MRKFTTLVILLFVMLACALPGSPAVAPLPTFDPNSPGTAIALTAAVAQTQTALKLPTATITPKPTHTPSITPTFTPTFIFKLSTLTPIPTYTFPPTVGTIQTPGGGNSSGDDDEAVPTKNKDEDPRKMSGKEWSCVWYGVTPPRNTVFKPGASFTVQWMLFNSGTQSWPYLGVDLVYKSGYRHIGTKIQDFTKSVPSGGEIWVRASFEAPKRAGDYQTFFYLLVGKKTFCPVAYYFTVEE
ncbi:MAG: hypothetical protein HYZ22_07880 [Chloroflexi bacterium]|nr:hypothetical protein [Chloroflexota bacterium]